MKDRFGLGAETTLTLGGFATSSLAALGNFLIARHAGIDVSSWMYWFVLPAGAGLVGAAAASGYYLASLWTQRPATPILAVNMLAVGLSTYALIQYLSYHALTFPDGTAVSDQVPFWTYYRFSIETTNLRMMRGGGTTGELGALGYGYEALRVVGFLLGGFVVYLYLKDKPYCDTCKRYFGKRRLLLETPVPAEVDSFAQTLWFDVSDLAEQYQRVIGTTAHNGFRVFMAPCSSCDLKHLTFAVARKEREDAFAVYRFRGASPFKEQADAPTVNDKHAPAGATPATRDTSASGDATGSTSTPLGTRPRPTSIQCWSCKGPIEVTEQNRGRKVRCSKCGTTQSLPA
jgi:hypothetical protein